MLKEHIITEVKMGRVRNVYPRLIGKNGKRGEHGYGYDSPVVMLKTNSGFTGWGIGMADRTLKLLLEGARLSDVFDPAVGVKHRALCGADIALHDLAGKILGVPVWKMINPQSTKQANCYDGAIYLSDLTEQGDAGIEAVLQNCRDDVLYGFADFKVKIGRQTWMGREAGIARDAEVVRAVRKEFPTCRILVDANDAMNLQDIIDFMERVKDCSIYWIEEPFVENYDDFKVLKEYLARESPETLIADGEFCYNLDQVLDLADKGVLDVLLMDPESFGFTGWRKMVQRCKGTKILCSPHSWGTKLKMHYNAHISAAEPETCPVVEGVPDEIPAVDTSAYKLNAGILTLPETGGFGMELEFAEPVAIYQPY